MITKKDVSRLTIDIPKEDHRALKVFCAQSGKSMADVIRAIINKKIQRFSDLHRIMIEDKKFWEKK